VAGGKRSSLPGSSPSAEAPPSHRNPLAKYLRDFACGVLILLEILNTVSGNN